MATSEFCIKCGKNDWYYPPSGSPSRVCKTCKRLYARQKYQTDPIHRQERQNKSRIGNQRARRKFPERRLLAGAKYRARKEGLPLDLVVDDIVIPEFCPILGTRLVLGNDKASDASPSLDRFIPELGYVKGNIEVISNRANTIKNNGTAEEHRRIAEWIEGKRSP